MSLNWDGGEYRGDGFLIGRTGTNDVSTHLISSLHGCSDALWDDGCDRVGSRKGRRVEIGYPPYLGRRYIYKECVVRKLRAPRPMNNVATAFHDLSHYLAFRRF